MEKEFDGKWDGKWGHRVIVHDSFDETFYRLIAEDYQRFMKEVRLATTERQKQLLAAQSCQGHAMNGDKCFSVAVKGEDTVHHQYQNTTVLDIYKGILASNPNFAQSPLEILKERNAVVKELEGWITDAINSVIKQRPFSKYNPRRLLDSNGHPLMGIELFSHTVINDPKSVLIGIYLGSCMDSAYWREQAEYYFKTIKPGFSMHRGICTAGNLERILSEKFTISDLASLAENDFYRRKRKKEEKEGEKENEEEGIRYTRKVLQDKGMVVDFSKLSKHERKYGVDYKYPIVPVYVELNKGFGSSDDAAFNYAGLVHGIEAAFGLFLIDAVDTLDKCLPRIKENGTDEAIGETILKRFGGFAGLEKYLGITSQDVVNLIFAAAIDKDHPQVWPSCSQRRFLEYDANGNYALLNHVEHLKYITEDGLLPDVIRLSIKEIPGDMFYAAFRDRVRFMYEKGIITMDKVHKPERIKQFCER